MAFGKCDPAAARHCRASWILIISDIGRTIDLHAARHGEAFDGKLGSSR
jgi:hypothetical protein